MAIELMCGNCQGSLLVEIPGTAVRCPHCAAILQSPAEPVPPAASLECHDLRAAALADLTATLDAPLSPEKFATDDFFTAGPGISDNGPELSAASSVFGPAIDGPSTRNVDVNSPGVADFALAAATADDSERVSPPDPHSLTAILEPEPVAVPFAARPVATVVSGGAVERESGQSAPLPVGPSPLAYKLLISYASALTLISLYLSYIVWSGTARARLPDLPDLELDVKKGNKVTRMWYLPPENQIHPAHILRLGESQRFGSLRVTPLRVSRGLIEFTFYDPSAQESRSPAGPVLKLHLRIENVSDDQEFVPIDRQLVFAKEQDKQHLGLFKANNFVCRANERAQHGNHVFVYDLSSDWLINGQNLDGPLKPGEVVQVLIPTEEEGVDQLEGDLVWRVHFRKGYNPQSYRGVTTLIEVVFNRSEIIDEVQSPQGRDA